MGVEVTAAPEQSVKYVLYVIDDSYGIQSGFRLIGPFIDPEDACSYADEYVRNTTWWCIAIEEAQEGVDNAGM